MDQTAFTDAQSAYDQFTSLVLDVADEHDWTDAQREQVLTDVDAAWVASDDGVSFGDLWGGGEDVDAFWEGLGTRSTAWTAPNADKLRAVIRSAGVTVADEVAEADATAPSTIAAGTVSGAAEDIATAADTVTDAVSSPYFWPLVGGFLLLGVIVAVKVR